MAETRRVVYQLEVENREGLRQLGRLEVETKKYQRDLRELNKTISVNGKATREQEVAVGRLNAQIRANQGEIRELKNDLSGLTAAGLRFRDKMSEAGRAGLGAFGLAAGGVVVGVTALARAITGAIDIMADFDKSQSTLAAVLGKSKDEIAGLTQEAKDYGATTAFTASQVSDLQIELSKLGFTQEQISDSTAAILDLAAAADTDLGNAAQIAASTVRQFGLAASDTQEVVDVMAKSFGSTALNIEYFSTGMATVGPVAKNAGVSIQDTTALLGVLANRGLDASTAGTSLRNIFLELSKQGLTFEEAMTKINTATDKNAVALDLFGKRGATAATIIAGAEEETRGLADAFRDAAGAADEMAKKQLDNLRGDQLLLQSAWEGFILSIEDGQGVIGGFFRTFTQGLTTALELITSSKQEKALEEYADNFTDRLETNLKEVLGNNVPSLESDYAQELISDAARRAQRIQEGSLQNLYQLRDNLEAEIGGLEAQTLTARGKVRVEALALSLEDVRGKIQELQQADSRFTGATRDLNAELQASIDLLDEDADKNEKAKGSKERHEKAVRTLTTAYRDFLKAQRDIEQTVDPIETVSTRGDDIDKQPIQPPDGYYDAYVQAYQDYSDKVVSIQTATDDEIASSAGALFGSLSRLAAEGSAEAKAFAILEATANTYVGATKALSSLNPPASFIAAAATIAAGLANVATIQGLAEGGIVNSGWGHPIQRSNGDNVLVGLRGGGAVTLKGGEAVLNDQQQDRVLQRTGMSIGQLAGLPGFVSGGVIPRPSPTTIVNNTISANLDRLVRTPIYTDITEVANSLGRRNVIKEIANG